MLKSFPDQWNLYQKTGGTGNSMKNRDYAKERYFKQLTHLFRQEKERSRHSKKKSFQIDPPHITLVMQKQ